MPDSSAARPGPLGTTEPRWPTTPEDVAYIQARLEEIRAASENGSAEWADPISDARWLLAEVDRLRAALYTCAAYAGEDTSGGTPTWPDISDWAIEAVLQLRADYNHD